MQLDDLEHEPPTIDPTPRLYPRGIRRRAVEAGEKPAFELRGTHLAAIVISGTIMASLIIIAVWSFSGSKPVQQVQPTDAPAPTTEAHTFLIAPTALPVTPQSTGTPTPDTVPTPPAIAAPEPSHDVQPIGQGLTLAESEQAPVVDQYLANVAEQAPHSPRGDGQAGPNGGDWVAVPTITSAQAEVISQQAPHKVR